MLPEHEIFLLCYNTASLAFEGSGFTVYDYLPGPSTSYPFLFIGETFSRSGETKDGMTGEVTQTVHIYQAKARGRYEVDKAISRLILEMRKEEKAGPYQAYLKSYDVELLTDNTTDTPLIHGVVNLTFSYFI